MGERISNTSQNLSRFSSKINAPLPNTFSWKEKSFQQIISAIQKNGSKLSNESSSNYSNMGTNVLLPQPLKHYRKEIASVDIAYPLQPRRNISIDEINRPGGTIMINGYTPQNTLGLDKIIIDSKTAGEVNNTTEHPGLCKSVEGTCLDKATIARRRVRTSGKMNTSYNSNTQQYLNNRNKSFQQNSYQYLQIGNSSAKPGSANAGSNTYRTQSYIKSTVAIYDVSGCNPPVTNVYFKPNNWEFSTQGSVDSSAFTLRRKFNAITNNVAVFKRAYGDSVANAMGYGIADSVYTYKNKIGFPLPRRPRVLYKKPTEQTRCCNDTHIQGGMWGKKVL